MNALRILIQHVKSGLIRLFGLQPVTLSVAHPSFVGQTGEVTTDACTAVARRGDKPLRTRIDFEILDGKIEFQDGGQQTSVWTTEDGEASVNVDFTGRGGSVIKATLAVTPDELIFFDGRSEGVADRLIIKAPCEVSADPGDIELLIYAYDHRNDPVGGANIELSMFLNSDHSEDGEVREVEPGVYQGHLSSHVAGKWEISANDYTARVITRTFICIHPSTPDKIEILNKENPRIDPPRNAITLPIAVYDKYDNFLDSSTLSVTADGRVVHPLKEIIGDPALYRIQHASHGDVEIEVSAHNADIVLREHMTFPAAALIHDKSIQVGSEYTMPLYLFPGIEKEIKEGNLDIAFDHNQVAFTGLARNETEDDLRIEHSVSGNTLHISFSSESGLSGGQYKDGLYIADTSWRCGGEGKTLFSINGGMSPTFKQCDHYMIQKQRPVPKDLCIQILYMSPIGMGPPAGVERSARWFEFILNNNWEECCPTINVNVKMINLQTESRVKIYQAIGRENKIIIKSKADYGRFRRAVSSSWEVDPNCLSVFLIDIDYRSDDGRVRGISRIGEGPAVVDPDHAGKNSLTLSHELAHTLGLRHTKPNEPFNIVGKPKGLKLNSIQCDKIRSNPILQ